MMTGIGTPFSIFWVCALNALQNSMMFRPRWPSAGPMGGAGFALPAGTCSLMNPTTFFAMSSLLWVQANALGVLPESSSLLYLTEFKLHRRGPAENRHRHAQPALLVIHVFHRALEVRKRPVLDAHHLAVLEQHLR